MILMSFLKKKINALRKDHRTKKATARVYREAASVGSGVRVNAPTTVTAKTFIGGSANFNGLSVRGCGECHIGNFFHSGKGCVVITQNHNYDNGTKIPYDETYECKSVSIEDFVWIGDSVMILPGVTIREGAIIQAGSVVVSDIPYCAIAGGHPARVFAYRDIEHFEQLKSQRAFH